MSMQTSFINSIKDGAIASQKKHGVLASITISQAILESAWGRSQLSAKYKNLFGIKADAGWKGPRVNMRTGEYRNGSHVMENWGFRVYSSYAESIEDHALFLVNNPRYRKNGFFDAKNYTGQAKALVRAGYATSPDYARQLIQLIEQYNLNQYDNCSRANTCNSSVIPLWKQCINGDAVRKLQYELNNQCCANIKEDGYFGESTLNKCCIVKQGAKGNITKIIQTILINKNYKIEADGIFGEATTESIKHFQGNKGLIQDGVVGKDTWKALFKK
ncbi:glucosaminidase domain-containing protein [Clostridium botulinum]|uniref:glucosaminidase domain-containing protein n=1 Tax=Clostridium botulinum TaxID=1491 RepID=UPI0006A61454|nr:glucosaminidase domain-containing protein [Clostridium botulinum]